MFGVYATFEELKEYLTNTANANFHPKDDDKLKRFCVEMSRKFDTEANRAFVPRKQMRYYDHPGRNGAITAPYPPYSHPGYASSPIIRSYDFAGQSNCLLLDDDLLEVITLTTDNGDTTISSADYWLRTGNSYNHLPYDNIKLKPTGTTTVFGWTDTFEQANAVTGIWGYHEQYSDAWQQVDTVGGSGINASVTSVTVSDVDGVDEVGLTPRFKTQQLIRMGSEYCYIIGKSPDSNTLDIKRGVNGTTAAAQTAGTAIYVYRPMEELQHAMKVLATWAYRRANSIGGPDDYPVASPSGVVIMPSALPGEVKSMLAKYKREFIR